jgi:transposase
MRGANVSRTGAPHFLSRRRHRSRALCCQCSLSGLTNSSTASFAKVIDALDLASLGFDGVEPAATGRPAFHPSVLLKLYIYPNRVQSTAEEVWRFFKRFSRQ